MNLTTAVVPVIVLIIRYEDAAEYMGIEDNTIQERKIVCESARTNEISFLILGGLIAIEMNCKKMHESEAFSLQSTDGGICLFLRFSLIASNNHMVS